MARWIAFVALPVVVGLLNSPRSEGQSPAFEVATVKPSAPDETLSIRVRGRQFVTTNTSLVDLIAFAYGIHARQVTGGPPWLGAGKYDLLAETDMDGRPNAEQLRAMVQMLVMDRLKLTFHRDRKELSVYTIVVGKTGPKLNKSTGDPSGTAGIGFKPTGEMTVKNATIADFAGLMQRYIVDRPVVDQTGISGRYDFSLKWAPDDSQFGGHLDPLPPQTGDSGALPDLYTVLDQQLGLKLASAKAPVEVLVIDHVERPTEN